MLISACNDWFGAFAALAKFAPYKCHYYYYYYYYLLFSTYNCCILE